MPGRVVYEERGRPAIPGPTAWLRSPEHPDAEYRHTLSQQRKWATSEEAALLLLWFRFVLELNTDEETSVTVAADRWQGIRKR